MKISEQNDQLHAALKRAKQHILSQDKMIKSLQSSGNAGSFSEAVTSLQNTVNMKTNEVERLKQELEDTRSAARREQRLIISAWYNLGLQLCDNPEPNQETSWLKQQRRKMRMDL